VTSETHGTETGWPFWAPSDNELAARALELADLQPGERLVDFGCGDGRVLVRAAERGAIITGVECEPALAKDARVALETRGLRGSVLEDDIFVQAKRLEADVAFCYLSPATLQRLARRLAAGVRLVTVDYEVPGLRPDASDGSTHLYVLPGRTRPRRTRRVGWHAEGTLVAVPPRVESLTCLEVRHPGGRVEIVPSATLGGALTVATGLDFAEPGETVAVDLRWDSSRPGRVSIGTLRVAGGDPHAVIAVHEDWSDQPPQWDLSDEGAANIAAYVATRSGPFTLAELLTAAEA
jgi:hypothetical protein